MIVITEVFTTVQGEGSNTGIPSFFLRMGVCPLACAFCDTPYSSYEVRKNPQAFKGRDADAIAWVTQQYKESGYGIPHFVITGGEPLLSGNLSFYIGLAARLKSDYPDKPFTFEFETCGTESPELLAPLFDLVEVHFDISPKLKSSNQLNKMAEERRTKIPYKVWNAGTLEKASNVCFKFVVGKETLKLDLEETIEVCDKFGLDKRSYGKEVCLMPEGVEFDKEWYREIAELCFKQGFRFAPRLHIQLWGNERAR